MDLQKELIKHLIYISFLKGQRDKTYLQINYYVIHFREINFEVFMAYLGDIFSVPLVKQ